MFNETDFYFMIKRIYNQKTGKWWSKDDSFIQSLTQPTEKYMKWLENELNKAWSALEDNGLKK
jgi:hypothetical protein